MESGGGGEDNPRCVLGVSGDSLQEFLHRLGPMDEAQVFRLVLSSLSHPGLF